MSNIQSEIIEKIYKSETIGFITHKDGDGDAFGSMLALERIISNIGKKTVIFSNEPLPQIFDILGDKLNYKPSLEFNNIDILICFDANQVNRFTIPEVVEKSKEKSEIIVIDHHLNGELEEFASIYWRDLTLSSTAEMVFNLITKMKLEIDKITATLLLLGIETDTMSLQFTNTAPSTFNAVAELMKKGAHLKSVVESAFGGKPIPTVKLLGRAINRLKISPSGFAYTFITLKDMSELNLTEQSTSGVANFLEQMEEAKIVAVFQEKNDGIVKVSLRSNNSDINVAAVCEKFGGGGHAKAAGCEIEGTVDSAIEKIIKEIK